MQNKNPFIPVTLVRAIVLGVIASSTAFISGCANLSNPVASATRQQTPEQIVAARSEARAQAYMKKDMKAVYSFMTPAYRKRVSEERYELTHPQRFTLYSAKVTKVTCESESSCKVLTAWEYKTNFNQPGARQIDVGKITNVLPEHWIKLDGQWWYYTKE